MEPNRISYHESVRKMLPRLRADGMTNIWDRYAAQGMGHPDKRCAFCMDGVRCDLCSNGPCRADVAKDKRGVCGITGDGMAMRMMLLRNVLGASTYQYHTEQTIKTLKATAEGKTSFKIRDPDVLARLAQRLGISPNKDTQALALEFCRFVTEDFQRPYDQESQIVAALAPGERKTRWHALGVFPGGIHSEMMLATSSCLTNVDGYYQSLALKAIRMSIAMAYQSQIITEYTQDILFGSPTPHPMQVDLGVLDPDYVNILPNGHEPFLGFAMIQLAQDPAWQAKARAVGAKGLRIIANIETGQEIIQRWPMDDVLFGFTGNWIMQEAILATGCVDVFVADMNCSMPIDPIYAQKYHFQLIPASEVVAFEGVQDRINYAPERVNEQAAELLTRGIANFSARRAAVTPIRDLPVRESLVGYSIVSLRSLLHGSIEPLLDTIRSGKIRGVVGLVSCTALRDSGQDVHTVAVTKALIKRDILVLSMGCGNAALQVAGLCDMEATKMAGPGLRQVSAALQIPPVLSFGTCTDTGRFAEFVHLLAKGLSDTPVADLPVAIAAPEYMEQKATIDAIFGLAFGLYTYVNPVPFVTGAPNLVRLLTQDCPSVTGGRLALETDATAAADAILAHIESRRAKLHL